MQWIPNRHWHILRVTEAARWACFFSPLYQLEHESKVCRGRELPQRNALRGSALAGPGSELVRELNMGASQNSGPLWVVEFSLLLLLNRQTSLCRPGRNWARQPSKTRKARVAIKLVTREHMDGKNNKGTLVLLVGLEGKTPAKRKKGRWAIWVWQLKTIQAFQKRTKNTRNREARGWGGSASWMSFLSRESSALMAS